MEVNTYSSINEFIINGLKKRIEERYPNVTIISIEIFNSDKFKRIFKITTEFEGTTYISLLKIRRNDSTEENLEEQFHYMKRLKSAWDLNATDEQKKVLDFAMQYDFWQEEYNSLVLDFILMEYVNGNEIKTEYIEDPLSGVSHENITIDNNNQNDPSRVFLNFFGESQIYGFTNGDKIQFDIRYLKRKIEDILGELFRLNELAGRNMIYYLREDGQMAVKIIDQKEFC